ncbi:DUF4260 domain-containing protein [Pareuzebyella sediminis]|uniref:DUF4260 domain-containing protein n=1 Tax=Pareuzebyella sediminis TaxID=2607998 RepID=UPI0011EBDECB|nr:DUF4260 domain-containing protein [Pareuzebyella sediminis]
MKALIKLEEAFLFLLGIYLFSLLPYSWWWFPALILTPDIGMVGYVSGNRIGAVTYNIFHHRGLGVLLYLAGSFFAQPILQLIGIILFSHSAMDRIFGYGLKYKKGFTHTHLGEIGK